MGNKSHEYFPCVFNPKKVSTTRLHIVESAKSIYSPRTAPRLTQSGLKSCTTARMRSRNLTGTYMQVSYTEYDTGGWGLATRIRGGDHSKFLHCDGKPYAYHLEALRCPPTSRRLPPLPSKLPMTRCAKLLETRVYSSRALEA